MLFIKFIFLCIFIKEKCLAEAPKSGIITPIPVPVKVKSEALKCGTTFSWTGSKNTTNNFGLEMKLPFMDMIIENDRNVFVLKVPQKDLLFVLHGNELFQLIVGRKEKKLLLIGLLNGAVRYNELLGADVIHWHNYLILAVALPDHIDIYQISLLNIANRAEIASKSMNSQEAPLNFEFIQQLVMPGKYQKLALAKADDNKVMLVVAVNFTKLYGKLRTYEWHATYFNPIEEMTVPQLHVFQLLGNGSNYLVTGRAIRAQEKTIISVFEFQRPTMNLRNIQTLTVASRTVHALTFRDRNYLFGCSNKQKNKCNSYQMIDRQFQLYKQRSEKDYAFDKLVAGEYFLVGVRSDTVKMFSTARLDCYGSYTSNETEVSAILTHNNKNAENFFLLHYKQPYRSLIRIVEVDVKADDLLGLPGSNWTDTEEMSLNQHQHLFENSIRDLRSMLLKRKPAMDVFRRIPDILQPKMKHLESKTPVEIHAGNIGIIKLVGRNLISPLQLLERVHNIRKNRERKRYVRDTRTTTKLLMHLKLQNLTVDNLIYDGPILEGWHLNKSSHPLPTLTVNNAIKTKKIEMEQMLPSEISSEFRAVTTSPLSAESLKINQLNVENINGMPWSEFHNSLFLKNRDKQIRGRLIMQSETKIDHLETPLINGLIVKNLFNLNQPQTIESNIVFNGFLIKDLQAETVNGLNFAEDIVFRGQDSFIETPVSMHHVSVAGDLTLGEPTKLKRSGNENNLQQQYTRKVIINGTLTINNLVRELEDETQIVVADKLLSENELMENYLLKNIDQEFDRPVKFGNAKLTTPRLETKYLNDFPTEQHFLNKPNITLEKPLYIVFMNASIEGDVICKNYNSKLFALSKNVVRHGDVANITGTKVFESTVKIKNAFTLYLNDMRVNDLILKSDLERGVQFQGTKSFHSIEVYNKTEIQRNLNAKLLNNLPLEELLNYDYHVERLEIPHKLEALNVVFHKINGLSFDVFAKFNTQNDRLVLHKDLIVEGNVQFNENLMLETINDIDWKKYETSLVRVHENAHIEGEKIFQNELTITKELVTPLLNNVDFTAVLEQLLTKFTPQVIGGRYTFDSLEATNLDVTVINDMPTAAFIDTRLDEIIIDSDVIVPKLILQGNLSGKFVEEMPFENIDSKLLRLTQQNWRNLVVIGNAYWANDKPQNEHLQYLYTNAVRRVGDQVITGNVKLHRPLITKMVTKHAFPRNIDIDFIATDCLLKNTTAPQQIDAPKTFSKRLHLANVAAQRLLQVRSLNNIDILRLNASLYRLSSNVPIIGPLYFQNPPFISHLMVNGSINGIYMAQLYHGGNNMLPPIKLNSLTIDNDVEIGDINDMSLNYLLDNRITKNTTALEVFGLLKFENLVLNKHAHLQSINGIPIDNLIFKHSKHMQVIDGSKHIAGDLTLAGPAHVLRLNGYDLLAQYQKSVFIDRAQKLKNLVIDQATFEAGLQFEDPVLGSKLIKSQTEDVKIREKLNALTNDIKFIDRTIDNNIMSNYRRILYLDYDFNQTLLWQKLNDSIHKTWTFDIDRATPCSQQFLVVQKSINNDIYYLSNRITNLLTIKQGDLHVKAENFCKTQYRKIKSKITITNERLTKVIGVKKFIDNMQVFKVSAAVDLIILHALDENPKRHEIRILKIDRLANNITDWQTLTTGAGKAMKLYNLYGHTLLITSGLAHIQPIVNINIFNQTTQKFDLLQTIAGDFSFIELLSIDSNRYHLILSCQHCLRIAIYECNSLKKIAFNLMQQLQLPEAIDKLHAFTVGSDSLKNWYLMTSTRRANNDFHLTIYEPDDDWQWQYNTIGYFHDVQLAVPLIGSKVVEPIDRNLLLLVCGSEQCGMVKAVGYN